MLNLYNALKRKPDRRNSQVFYKQVYVNETFF